MYQRKFQPLKEKFSYNCTWPCTCHSLDPCPSLSIPRPGSLSTPTPENPLVLLTPVQQLFCQHQVLRITSWSVVATVVHPLGAPALLPPLWSAVGSHAATHESETRARPVLPPPSETLPGSTHYHHHLPHPQHYFDGQGRI